MMPKVDGLQLLASLRADPELRDIPVLLLSARAGEEAKVEGLAAGASDYLTKPFSARELIARVRSNLDMAALRRESQEALQRVNESLERQVQERTADLRDKEARLRTIFGTTYTYQGYMAVDGTLLDANPTSLAGINATLEDVIGRKLWETPWFAATPGMADFVRDSVPAVAAGETLRREIHVNLGEMGWHWFDFQMRPVLDATAACRGHRAGGGRRHGTAPRRGSAAPGAKNGGHRPADGRSRARLQQFADHHRRQSGDAAPASAALAAANAVGGTLHSTARCAAPSEPHR
jgi:PAS domain-containing protein